MGTDKNSSLISMLFQVVIVAALLGGLAYLAKRFWGVDFDTVKKKVEDFTSEIPDAKDIKE